MQVYLHETITICDPPPELLFFIRTTLYTDNPEYISRKKMELWLGDTKKHIKFYSEKEYQCHKYLTIPFGCFHMIEQYLPQNTVVSCKLAKSNDLPYPDIKLPLYPYQEEAVRKMICPDHSILVNGKSVAKGGILIGKCGAGKTQIGIGTIVALQKKALWITHTLDLVRQAYERAAMYMPSEWLGRIMSGSVQIGSHITFATVQTLCTLDLKKYRYEWDIIIVDECHRICGGESQTRMFFQVISSLAASYKFGLTATLHRADGLTQSARYALGEVLYEIPGEVLESKLIIPSVKVIDTGLLPSYVYLKKGEIVFSRLINYISSDKARNRLICEKIKQEAGHSCLVLSDRISQLESIRDLLPDDLQKTAVMIDGKMQTQKKKQARQDAINSMKSGSKKILFATYGLAKEGLDIPCLDRLFLASPKKDSAVVEQSLGRISRTSPGKKDAICYDFIDEKIGLCRGLFRNRNRTYAKMNVHVCFPHHPLAAEDIFNWKHPVYHSG